MANKDQLKILRHQLKILRRGVEAWNKWWEENPKDRVDLREVNLGGADLFQANLRGSNLHGAYLNRAILVKTNLRNAILTDCRIYGISIWGLNLEGAEQKDLAITPLPTFAITVDNLEVAQFLYLLLYSKKIREAINTVASKVVLILGRFTPERKVVLDALREELRGRGYTPVLFPFMEPHFEDSNLEDSYLEDCLILDPIETISTLAHMAKFLIADITDAKGLLAELESVVPELPSVPVMPIVPHTDYEDGLLKQIRRYPWVLEPYRYEDQTELIASIGERVIAPAETKVSERRPL